MEFKPSEYQEDIFEFIKYGYGNAVISAVAGSGKSKTIEIASNLIKPQRKALFLAFNNSIVAELKSKINRENTDIKTLHSLGFSILRYNFKDIEIAINENKYRDKMLLLQLDGVYNFLSNKTYEKNILKLCDLGRNLLANSEGELNDIVKRYNLILQGDEVKVAIHLIKWSVNSIQETNSIDYTDMIYLPNILNVKVFKYDFIIIDEAQDLSIAQIGLFRKCFKQGCRFIACGDDKQCINGFSGSDINSFNKLKNMPHTISLPLSISYRCPKKIVEYAKKYVPLIESHANAIDGDIIYNSSIELIKSGDMVICINTMPLIKLYIKLISNNIKCYIKGRDIGLNLIDIVNSVTSDNIVDIIQELDEFILNNENIFGDENTLTQDNSDMLDKIECIKIISENVNCKSELIEKITELFSDDKNDGICLSTIHKAKGLEADNVFILNKHLIPSKFAKQDWELEQERNLEYVACTRAKKTLNFIYLS